MKHTGRKFWGIHGIACLIILLMGCYNLEKLNYIAVLLDEFGYWGTAVSLAGYDWSELMETCAYYAPGYSFLLLPIVIFLPNWMWYKTAILLNVLLLLLTYFISVKVGMRLFPQANICLVAAAGVLTAIYPGNITYATVAWTETLQYFLIWLLTYLLVLLEEKFSYIKMVAVFAVATYLYFVHNRNIGVMAVLLVICYLIMRKNGRKLREYLWLVIFCILSYFAFNVFKDYEIIHFYGGGKTAVFNDFSVSGNMISNYFQKLLGNLAAYGISVYGKLFYLLLGTGFTFFAAVLHIGRLFKRNIMEKAYFDNYMISHIWCVAVTIVMLLLTALQAMGDERKDIIVYSRYFEYTLGPVLFVGILAVCSMDGSVLRKIMMFTVLFCLPGILKIPAEITEAKTYFNSICTPVLGAYYDNTDSVQTAFHWVFFTLNAIVITLFIVSFLRNKTCKITVITMIFLVVFVIEGFKSSTYMDKARKGFEAITEPIRDTLIERNEGELYYIVDEEIDPFSIQPKYLQYMVPEYKIHLNVRKELIDWTDKGNLLLVYKNDTKTIEFLELDDSFQELVSSQGLILYEKKP